MVSSEVPEIEGLEDIENAKSVPVNFNHHGRHGGRQGLIRRSRAGWQHRGVGELQAEGGLQRPATETGTPGRREEVRRD